MNKSIRSIAILGSGIMGSRIACHFANIGVKTLLLDIVPSTLSPKEIDKNLTLEHQIVRNRIVDEALSNTLKSNPAALYHKNKLHNITTGNFTDNLKDIATCDWILEAVVENIDIKKNVFEQVELYRKLGSIITTNTSGISINTMLEGRSDDFKKHFCGTHFFNPPRYLRLLEIIPSNETSQEVIDFLEHYGDLFLGKTTVVCNDTPAFIANRIGVFSIMAVFKHMQELGLNVDEVDALTGPISGRPKSATFRTCDIVGLDTLVKVAHNTYKDCLADTSRDLFLIPDYIEKMIQNNWLGDKSNQGFYLKTKDETGKKIQTLNLNTMLYEDKKKVKFDCIGAAKPIDELKKRIKILHKGTDIGAQFLQKMTLTVSAYCTLRINEIADHVYQIDDALKAGFAWELGPFETMDLLGIATLAATMQQQKIDYAPWLDTMISNGITSFYKVENGKKMFYSIGKQDYEMLPGSETFIILENYKPDKTIWSNSDCSIIDIGHNIINVEFHSKMNALGAGVIEGMNKAFDLAEQGKCEGIVIANDAPNFSAGANLMMLMMWALEEEWDELNFAIAQFQKTMMRVRYNPVPTIVAPHGLTLGGGCEMTMYADSVVASAETYIGLVEVGVGLIPGGGGTKETVKRISENSQEGDIVFNRLIQGFTNIATAKVATSAHEAYDQNILIYGRDSITINPRRLTADAKIKALQLAASGYAQPIPSNDITVYGKQALGALLAGAAAFNIAGFATDHDRKIAEKLAYVLCGGDLSQPSKVNEQYLLDLERDTFLSLLGERKTIERIQAILTTGKPLRN